MTDPVCIAIDWSGDATVAGQRRKIVTATVRGGRVEAVEAGRTRDEMAAWITGLAATDEQTFVGLDFSFSVPVWFAHDHRCQSIDDVWTLVTEHGEAWLRAAEWPFWGPRGTHRDPAIEAYRACERRLREEHHQPKSIFQIAGNGQVGPGSLRGMPHLAQLRSRGVAIWPFDDPQPAGVTALEIYPSAFTNGKRGPRDRVAWIGAVPRAVIGDPARLDAVASDDAFDAVVAAIEMWKRRDELVGLRQTDDPVRAIEGDVWP